MSGFSADWLRLREPADAAARDRRLVARVAAALATVEVPSIVDLGAGTGATLRAVAPQLGAWQRWTLVDADADLLLAARDALASWGEGRGLAPSVAEGLLRLADGTRRVDIAFLRADLARDALPVEGRVDLVTATALFDLVSARFVARLAAELARRGCALYAALDVDAAVEWFPPLPGDGAVDAAFRSHQTRDKGFGGALGPSATATLAAAFEASGYAVATAPSPWRLGPGDRPLTTALIEGRAAAVRETGLVAPDVLAGWVKARRDGHGCIIGHRDLLAVPRRRSGLRSTS
jgi:SAM-dependent methyltransferase